MNWSPSEVFVIVPAYNEARVLGACLEDLVAPGFRVIVVDDGSEDETYAEALRHPVVALRHPCNLGQGAALQTGITFALRQPECRFLVTFDADGQHLIDDIDRLICELVETGAAVALGSRFKGGLHAPNIRRSRLLVLKLAVLFTRLTTRLHVTDTHNGLRALTRQAAACIQIRQNRMSHATEILHQIAKLRLPYVEVPVTIRYTNYSTAKGQSLWESVNILWDSLFGGLR